MNEIENLATENLATSMISDSKYGDIIRGIKEVLTYTVIPEEIKQSRDEVCKPKTVLHISECMINPSYFVFHILGIKPYLYQHYFFEKVRKGSKRIIMISSRQIGKTSMLAMIALWAAYYNTMPSGLYKNTKIIIVSKGDTQAKHILSEIKKLIEMGDRTMSIRTKGVQMDYVSRELADDQPQNTSQITFRNGSTIKSLPPTDSARGYSADILFTDEIGFIEEDLYYDVLEPTTSAVNGAIFAASTPNGASGLAYKILNPFNEREEVNTFERFWIPWWYCENPEQYKMIESKKASWIAEGKLKNFQQEYEALFTVSESNFFDFEKVDASVDKSLAEVMDWNSEPCSLGLDYGWKTSNTSIVIVSKSNDGILRARMIHKYPLDGSDVDIYKDVVSLTQRFNLRHIIPDDASMGYLTNQRLKNDGYPVTPFNFRSDQNAGERNRGYYLLRTAINTGKLKLTNHPELIKQLKVTIEIKKKINVTIEAAAGERSDIVDALCMACYPFLVETEDDGDLIGMIIPDEPKLKVNPLSYRQDHEWANMNGIEEMED